MKVVIVGGGPGGYVAAIRCAQYGGEVVLIERANLGGTCVNEGCIPTKALLKGVQPLVEWKQYGALGLVGQTPTIHIPTLIKHTRKAILTSRQGIQFLLKKNTIRVIKGDAVSIRNNCVVVNTLDQEESISFDKLILATGSISSNLPHTIPDQEKIIFSDTALELKTIPKRFLIVGGGVIGLELATIYNQLGSKVTIVEWQNQVLPCEDQDAANLIEKVLIQNGVQIFCQTKVESIVRENDVVKTRWVHNETVVEEEFDTVLIAIGRQPNIVPHLLDPMSIEYSKKGVVTNEYLETSHPDVYCIGDLNGKWLLAHTASREGLIAAARIFGKNTLPIDYTLQPSVVFTYPEFAAVGKRNASSHYTFPYLANGKARASGVKEGFVKLSVEQERIVGGMFVGEHAADMISLVTMAMQSKMTLAEITSITFPHPTFSEVFSEATEVAEGLPLHIG